MGVRTPVPLQDPRMYPAFVGALSAFYVCFIYSSALQTSFFMEANQTAPMEAV